MHFKFDQYEGITNIWGEPALSVTSVHYDSRKVTPGSAFVCMNGENINGHAFMEDSIANGATVIVGDDRDILFHKCQRYPHLTFLLVEDVRGFLAQLSISIYNAVHEKLITIGVTGTNGKTTTAAYVRSLMNLLHLPAGFIGTTGIFSSKGKLDFEKSTPTTPESPDLHRIFHDLNQAGDKLAVMEVSSVAIEQKRVAGIDFDIAIHTNLSPEHLEFHHTFENYKRAKLKLFKQAKAAVVNIDDEGLAQEIMNSYTGPVFTYSLKENNGADLTASHITVMNAGTVFQLKYENEYYMVRVPIIGTYNVANLLAAIAAALHLGFSMAEILRVLSFIEGAEGRFEILKSFGNRKIILDYAHTPAALHNLLTEVKKLSYDRLIILITGIGIRDRAKMPQMAAAIEGKADEIVVSVDHPGYSDPREIVDQVLSGFNNPSAGNIHTQLTRHEGVVKALSLSRENDLILLTSGCINGAQIVKGQKIPHSDKDIITNYFERESLTELVRV